MTTNNRSCIKNMQHEWELVETYRTHLLKQCWRCKVKRWQPRRNIVVRVA